MNNESPVSFPILRKFNTLSEAIVTVESEGKLDLSYNRDLAVRDAKYCDHRSKPVVLELGTDEGGLFLLVVAPDGMQCLTKYSPFSSCIHDGPFGLMLPTKLIDGRLGKCDLGEAEHLTRFGYIPNREENRLLLAKAGAIASH